ncbi:MAG: transcription elongation factor GreB [Cellvibrionales bacterium]|nr:transcription elongation factor GreB [Cellvibrionales bacterium]
MPTPLVTPKGHQQLKDELHYLWRELRPQITEKVSWAASLGDRSENADYKENKAKLRQIDKRIRYLQKRLDQLKIVEPNPVQFGQVFFGAWVTLTNLDTDEQLRLQIVGYDEIFDRKDAISIDSPMARALLKKHVDDEVTVKTQTKATDWLIEAIDYKTTERADQIGK